MNLNKKYRIKSLPKYQKKGSVRFTPEQYKRFKQGALLDTIDEDGTPIYNSLSNLPEVSVEANKPVDFSVKGFDKFKEIMKIIGNRSAYTARTLKDVSPIGAAQDLYERGPEELTKDIKTFGQSFANYLKSPLPYYISTPQEEERFGSILDAGEVIPFAYAGSKLLKGADKAGKALTKGPSITPSQQTLGNLDDLSLSTLKAAKPYANRFDNIIDANPLTQDQARNLVSQGKINEIYSRYEKGANTIDNFLQDYLKDLTSEKGIKRLTNQEYEYLKTLEMPERMAKKNAETSAFARINEIKDIKNLNRKFSQGKSELSGIIDNPSNFNNAYYTPATKKNIFTDELMDFDNPFKIASFKRIGLENHPGSVALGTMFSKSLPTAAHEISGHGLQAMRVLPVDNRLRKLDVDLSKLNKNEQSQYDYFMTGSGGLEPSAYLHEFREAMLQAGLIKKRYQHITPDKIQTAKAYFNRRPSGVVNAFDNKFSSDTRIVDFMNPTQKNYKLLADELNKLPVLAGAAATGAAANAQKQRGGEFQKLVDKYTTKGWQSLTDQEKQTYKEMYQQYK